METALTDRKARINAEATWKSLDQLHESLQDREQALATHEAEATRRDELLAQLELDQSRQSEELEAREGNLARAMDAHDQGVARHTTEVAKHQENVKKAD